MRYTIELKNHTAKVAISGGLTDQSEASLKQLNRELAGKVRHVDFDCAGIDGINSTGVAYWVAMLQEMEHGISYEFSRCSIFFMDYANLITDITNGAPIVSFFAPMKCQTCGKPASPLLLTESVDRRRGFGQHACPHCQGALVSEVDPEDYLMFLEEA